MAVPPPCRCYRASDRGQAVRPPKRLESGGEKIGQAARATRHDRGGGLRALEALALVGAHHALNRGRDLRVDRFLLVGWQPFIIVLGQIVLLQHLVARAFRRRLGGFLLEGFRIFSNAAGSVASLAPPTPCACVPPFVP